LPYPSPLLRRATLGALALVLLLPAWASAEGTRTLYLIRHGHYDYRDESDPEVGKNLVPLGVAQARLVAARLRSLPVEMTAIYTSPMTRARQTAMVMLPDFPGLELQVSRSLRECVPANRRADIMETYAGPEMEACGVQLEEAVETFFTPSPDGDRHEILVAHGNVIRYLVTRALDVDPEAWLGFGIGNCSLTVVQIGPDGSRRVLAMSDVGHIPPNLQTGWDRDERLLIIPDTSE